MVCNANNFYQQNKAAAQAARRLLEFDEDTVEVEKDSLGKIIGKGGVTIKQIEALSEGVCNSLFVFLTFLKVDRKPNCSDY